MTSEEKLKDTLNLSEQEQIPETLRRHQEMLYERQKELEFLGTLDYREIIQRVNDRNRWISDE